MKDTYVDVRLELDLDALTAQEDPTRFIVELAREEADRLCAEHGAQLRTDSAPEVYLEKGEHRLTGQMCLLVATRWKVRAPYGVPEGPPRVV